MKLQTILFLLFILGSCAQIQPLNNPRESKEEVFTFKPTEFVLQPGMVELVKFDVPSDFLETQMTCVNPAGEEKNQTIPLVVKEQKAFTYMSISYFAELKSFDCFVKYRSEEVKVVTFNVKAYPYPSEELNVARSKVDLSAAAKKRIAKEWLITSKLYNNSASYFLFDEPFDIPLNSYRTSIYGTKRVFNNKKSTQHLGNDFRAKIGVPIPVANRGKVIFTGDLFYTGKVVIVDHGMNIFSNYAHLSKIHVKEGDVINKGEIVGLAGMTGRVTGPHLHWGVKVQGHYIDGFSLVRASKKQFDQLENKK